MKTSALCAISATLLVNATFGQEPGQNDLVPYAVASNQQDEPRQDGITSPNLSAPAILGSTTVPIHSSNETGVPPGIWGGVAGRYKASFHGDMTFYPCLGQSYPRNQPISWRTLSVTVDGQPLMQAGETPTRYHTDARYEYRFGAMTEAYDVTPDGLEQTFVFSRPPGTTGDLVVTGHLGSLLHGDSFSGEHRAIVLSDDQGQEIARYGKAWAIDAVGRTLAIPTSFDGERVVLTVPKAFCSQATYPLVIDPMLTSSAVAGNFDPVVEVDVCRDDTGNDLMVAYTIATSGGDLDAYAVICNDDFSGGSIVFSDDDNRWSNTAIACATADSPQVFCVAFTRAGAWLSNQSRIRFQVRASGNTTFSSTAQENIVTPNGSQYVGVDVGGTSFNNTGDHFLVVFQKENTSTLGGNTSTSEIWAIPVDITGVTSIGGGSIGTAAHVLKGTSTADAERPSVNPEAKAASGGSTTWVVCWQEFAPGDSDWDVIVRQVDAASNVSSTRYFSPGTRQKLGPQIAGGYGRYAIVYGAASTTQLPGKVSSIAGFGLDLVRLDWDNGSTTIDALPVVRLLDSDRFSDARWIPGAMAYDDESRSHWAHFHKSSFSGNLYVGRVGYNGMYLEGPNVQVEAGSGTNVLGGITFDDDHDRWTLAWGDGAYATQANHFAYPTPSAAPSTSGISCSAATISWYGSGQNQQIGHEFTGVRLSGMPSGSISALSLGFYTMAVQLPVSLFGSGCYQNAEVFLTTDLRIGASAGWQISLPEFISPDDLFFQGYHTNAAGDRFLSTHRLQVPVVK